MWAIAQQCMMPGPHLEPASRNCRCTKCPFITPQLLDKSQVWRHELTCNCCKLDRSCSKPSRLRIEAEQFSETNSQSCRSRCLPDFQISQLGIRVLLFFTPMNWNCFIIFLISAKSPWTQATQNKSNCREKPLLIEHNSANWSSNMSSFPTPI